MSSQLFTIPLSTGYFRVRIPLLAWASSPTKASLSSSPIMALLFLGLPTIAGKQHLGASSPAIPALHYPDPLSITTAGLRSSDICFILIKCFLT
jgi:hypothetical protein